MGRKPDFSGWVTKFNVKCDDGRTIKPGAFRDCDGLIVPMVWQHDHSSPDNVLGHCALEYRKEGVYGYAYCNDSERGQAAKHQVAHGDITQFSIFANKLEQNHGDVVHGVIREVSLVLSGANRGAVIDNPILAHSGETVETEALIYSGEDIIMEDEKVITHDGMSNQELFDSLDENQKELFYELVHSAVNGDFYDEGEESMKKNIFDNTPDQELRHDGISFGDIIEEAKTGKMSLKDTYLAHAASDDMPNGQPGIDYGIGDGITQDKHLVEGELLPHAHELYQTPGLWDARHTEWVGVINNGVHRSPFARLKNMWFDITNDNYTDPTKLRAKGYMKGHKKVEEIFGLFKRTTQPTTIYKKQRIDRDDLVDITDFNIVNIMKKEMRMKLDEEIALAILVGDGRLANSQYKIDEACIRPIWKDDELYAIHNDLTGITDASTAEDIAQALIEDTLRHRREYRGKGNQIMFIDPAIHTAMLLLKDLNGRRIYRDDAELCAVMNIRRLVDCDELTGKIRTDASDDNHLLYAISLNMDDYVVGADKGGSVNMFDDFDIDFNQYVYLIETRISGSLLEPKSAMVYEAATEKTPNASAPGNF